MLNRTLAVFLAASLALMLLLAACAHSGPMQVLSAPPPTAYKVLGMVSGQGPNEQSAMAMAVDQATPLGADAIIVESRRPVGSVIIVTCKAIKYLAPPPAQ